MDIPKQSWYRLKLPNRMAVVEPELSRATITHTIMRACIVFKASERVPQIYHKYETAFIIRTKKTMHSYTKNFYTYKPVKLRITST